MTRPKKRRTPAERVFYSTTEKAGTFKASAVQADKLAGRPLRAGPRKGQLTIDTGVPAWNPGLVEIMVLGCHIDHGDDPHALALAVHQLRQAPDYLDALSPPLPLHLAGRAQEYVLPTLADSAQEEETEDTFTERAGEDGSLFESIVYGFAGTDNESGDPDPDQEAVLGLASTDEREDDFTLITLGETAP